MMLLGIDIGGTKTAACIGNENGRIVAATRLRMNVAEPPEQALSRIKAMAVDLLAENGVSLDEVQGVGLSTPGPVSLKTGMMLAPPNMRTWVNVPVLKFFQDAFGKPTRMNNDANACALAEYLFGEFRGTRDLVYLTMSTGLGAGFISNGRIVQGVTDTGGEVGHHVLDINGPPCPCGRRGCLELYCGGMNVANRLRERIAREGIRTAILDCAEGDPAKIDFRAFLEAVKLSDPFALECWAEYIERLAQGVGTIIMFMNPSVIVMGTIAIHAGEMLLAPLRAALPRYAWPEPLAACEIKPSSLGAHIGELSALALAQQACIPET